jgi:hypothetical protein
MTNPETINLSLIFENAIAITPTSPACLYLYLEDVGRVDAPAWKLASSSIKIDQPVLAGELMKVTLMAPVTRPEGHYAVRAHLSLSGEVSVGPEDYLTTQAYSLPNRKITNDLKLVMRKAT